VIGLETAHRDEGVCALSQGFTHQELQLSEFIAAPSEVSDVVPFHVKVHAAKGWTDRLREPRQPLDRRWDRQQRHSRESLEIGKFFFCHESSWVLNRYDPPHSALDQNFVFSVAKACHSFSREKIF
jgi:hypothetical protein